MIDGAAASAWVLLVIAPGKILTTSLTIGSGGSGGELGPSMVIGGCGGGALGIALHNLLATRSRAEPGEFRNRGHGRLLCRRGSKRHFQPWSSSAK